MHLDGIREAEQEPSLDVPDRHLCHGYTGDRRRIIGAGLVDHGRAMPDGDRYTFFEMSNPRPQPSDAGSLELPVESC